MVQKLFLPNNVRFWSKMPVMVRYTVFKVLKYIMQYKYYILPKCSLAYITWLLHLQLLIVIDGNTNFKVTLVARQQDLVTGWKRLNTLSFLSLLSMKTFIGIHFLYSETSSSLSSWSFKFIFVILISILFRYTFFSVLAIFYHTVCYAMPVFADICVVIPSSIVIMSTVSVRMTLTLYAHRIQI
jgi:hypothetical protein